MTTRRKTLTVDPDVLLGLGKRSGIKTVGSPIPPDARVLHRCINERGLLVMIIESDAFPEVFEGSWLTEIHPGIQFSDEDCERTIAGYPLVQAGATGNPIHGSLVDDLVFGEFRWPPRPEGQS